MKRAILVCSLLLAATGAAAQNLQFLRDQPISYFKGKDMEIFLGTLDKLLEKDVIGALASWQNPETGSRGKMKLLRSFEMDGLPCKKVQVANSAGGRSSNSAMDLCKVGDEWKIAN